MTDAERTFDDEVLRRLRRRDRSVLSEIERRHGDRLRAFLLRLLDAERVDDVVHEVWVRLMEKPPPDGWRTSSAAWLFRVARNAAIDRLRARRIHDRAVRALWRPLRDRLVVTPLQRLEEREFAAALERELRRLPESFRTAFILREMEGLEYEEIAAVLSVGAKTVSTRLHRARRRLRRALASWLEE